MSGAVTGKGVELNFLSFRAKKPSISIPPGTFPIRGCCHRKPIIQCQDNYHEWWSQAGTYATERGLQPPELHINPVNLLIRLRCSADATRVQFSRSGYTVVDIWVEFNFRTVVWLLCPFGSICWNINRKMWTIRVIILGTCIVGLLCVGALKTDGILGISILE